MASFFMTSYIVGVKMARVICCIIDDRIGCIADSLVLTVGVRVLRLDFVSSGHDAHHARHLLSMPPCRQTPLRQYNFCALHLSLIQLKIDTKPSIIIHENLGGRERERLESEGEREMKHLLFLGFLLA